MKWDDNHNMENFIACIVLAPKICFNLVMYHESNQWFILNEIEYSKSSNSVNICSKNTSRYLKSHCLNLYYDVCEKSRYIEESRYFTYKIEYFGTKKLIAL